MINYIIQVIILQTVFLFIYDLFLAKETFFNTNRLYLLCTPILSFIIPFINIKSLKAIAPVEITEQLPELFIYPETLIETTEVINSFNYISAFYYAGVIIFTLLFLFKFSKLIMLIRNNTIVNDKDSKFVVVANKKVAFSFFNYIFIGTEIVDEKRKKIIEHELIHSKEKHSLDLIIFEILKIALWFNPIIYLFQKRITTVHEYIADKEVLKNNEREDYFNSILSEVFQIDTISFTNQFYLKSIIKKRIAMMTKRKSKQWKQLKYLTILPILFGSILYTSCKSNKPLTNVKSTDKTIVEGPVKVIYFNGKATETFNGKSLEDVLNKHIRPLNTEPQKLSINYSLDDNKKNDTLLVRIVARNNTVNTNSEEFVYKKGDPVPFALLNSPPSFKNSSCYQGDKSCFSKDMAKYVADNFDKSVSKGLGLPSGRTRIFVMFEINDNGEVVTAKCRAPHPKLKQEALRVVNSIPNLNPGKYNDNYVSLRYSLPISFIVE